jgi:hypothetical protein
MVCFALLDHCAGLETELCDIPKYDGLIDLELLYKTFELQIPEQQILLTLDIVLKATLSRWWVAHK